MPVPSMAYAFGVQMLVIDVMRYFQVPAPIRISSLPRGSPLRPGIYSIIEDVCAVDGSGGTEFRQRLNLRYLSSHHFRLMLHRLTLFWAFGSLGVAVGTTAIIFTTHRNVAYVVRFPLSSPFMPTIFLLHPSFVPANIMLIGSSVDGQYPLDGLPSGHCLPPFMSKEA